MLRTSTPLVRTLAVVFGAAILAIAAPVRAQSTGPTTLSLTVSPLVVEFRVGSGEAGTAAVTIHNGGAGPERILAQRMDWRVAPNGSVRVEQPGTEGAASIADYVRIEPADVTLAPGETRDFALTLDVPASFPHASAVYHSGFLVRAVPVGKAVNFGPAATVVVYDTVGTPRSHVKVTEMHVATPASGSAVLSARIVNDGTAYARTTGRIIMRRDGHVVVDQTESIPVMFANDARVYTKVMHDLAPGAYDVSFTLDYGGPTLIEGTTEVRIR